MRKLLVLILLLFSWPVPLHAQDGECEIDLTEVSDYLAEAQAALDSGDNTAALTAVIEARAALEDIEENCVAQLTECTINSVALCVEILEITLVDGQILKPNDVLNVTEGDKIEIESITYAATNQNLQIVGERHGKLSFAYGFVLPAIENEQGQKVVSDTHFQATGAVNPITATESNTLFIADRGGDWTVASNWSHLIVLIMHDSPNEERIESPIAWARIELNVRSQ